MKTINFIISLILAIGLVQSQQQKESTESLQCQAILKSFYQQAQILVEAHSSQNYAKMVVENLYLQHFLKPVEQYCPTLSIEKQTLNLQYPFDCQRSMAILIETFEQEDIVSKFQIIKEIVSFQANSCLPYDLEFENGVKSLVEQYIQNSSKKYNPKNKKGTNCLVCGVGITMLDNYIVLHDLNIAEFIGNKGICKMFSGILETLCDNLFDVVGPIIVEDLTKGYNSDVVCNDLGACEGYEQCQLHPEDSQVKSTTKVHENQAALFERLMPGGILDDLINKFADQHLPILDYDGDRFSDIPTLRGYDWRGEDCQKFNKKVYPGRQTVTGTKGADYNCNGISGSNPDTGVPYKTQYCDGTGQLGTLLFGDSAGAHFSIPGKWFNVSEWGPGTFSDLLPRIMDEGDVPQRSAGTGWQGEDPFVSSFYLKLLERNRCNRNDYQNMGVNGARSTNEMKNMLAVARDPENDFPAMIFWELIGNDVCSSHTDIDHMTSPETFKEKITELWEKLDTIVPKGSHMVVTGVADGRILYKCLADKENPIGVKYSVFYNYMNCLKMSPCAGWMNSDPVIRDQTSFRAAELNEVYKEIIATQKFENFDIQYYDFAIEQAIEAIEALGGTCQDAIEPVDGFHPSQLAQAFWADYLWEQLDVDQPTWKGDVNPNNEQIINQFGEGYRFSDTLTNIESKINEQYEVIEL